MDELTADTARQITMSALDAQDGEVGQRYRQIIGAIKKAAEKALTSTTIDDEVEGLNSVQFAALRKRLEGRGFTVSYFSTYQGSNYTVEWAERETGEK